MNFNGLKKLVILAVAPLILASGNHVAFAGAGSSKPKKSTLHHQKQPKLSPEMQRADEIINGVPGRPGFLNAPMYAEDGGMAYFWAWNHVFCGEDFDAFVTQYSRRIDNTTSASSLPDSQRNENWATQPMFGNGYFLEWFEESREPDPSKYLLRVDEAHHLIYTVRKSGDLYLFTFYFAHRNTHQDEAKLVISCFVLSSSMGNIKKLLLPVDRALLD